MDDSPPVSPATSRLRELSRQLVLSELGRAKD